MKRRDFLVFAAASGTLSAFSAPGVAVNLPESVLIAFGRSCSFCGREIQKAERLAGPPDRPGRICIRCVRFATGVDAEVPTFAEPTSPPPLPSEEEAELFLRALGVQGATDEPSFQRRVAELTQLMSTAPSGGPAASSMATASLSTRTCAFCSDVVPDDERYFAGFESGICVGCVEAAAAVLLP